MIAALLVSFTQVAYTAPVVAKSAVTAKATEATKRVTPEDIERISREGKTPNEKRNLVIQAYKDNAFIRKAAEDIRVDKTDLLSHLATNPQAVETVEYTVSVLANPKASALDKRAAESNVTMLRHIARSTATSSQDQADIASTRKAVVLGAYVAKYGAEAVAWHEAVSKRMSEGVKANLAVRNAAETKLGLKGQEVDKFMNKAEEESLANCRL